MKFVVFDAGPLISLTLSGMLDILEKLKTKDIEFILTPQVKREVVDKADSIKKYKLEAVRIKKLIKEAVIKDSENFVDEKSLKNEIRKIIDNSRKALSSGKEKLELIQEGEASCLAFSNLCNCESLIVIDERTTRLLTEDSESLRKMMEKKLHLKIRADKKALKSFKDFKYIRSSELVFMAYSKGLIDLEKDVETLEAILYSLKYHGTAISSREIEDMKKLA